MRRTVVLQHLLPTGTSHLDWLIQTSTDPESRVMAFRVAARPDMASLLVFSAERIGDHRAFYLDHEGEVTGGRGHVSRVARGVVSMVKVGSGKIELEADFGRGPEHLTGLETAGGVWVFERAS
ncbi:MAG: hypothetical protein AMXMBFR58_33160 [Phycisphaerae bacterium]|nr:hypothetical protein [Phycisphaerales bacterium]